MKQARRTFLQVAAAAVALPAAPRFARAQSYPAHPMRLIVGFPAGGQVDIIARMTAQWLGQTARSNHRGREQARRRRQSGRPGRRQRAAGRLHAVLRRVLERRQHDAVRPSRLTTSRATRRRSRQSTTFRWCWKPIPSFAPKTVAELIAAAKAKPGSISVGSPSAGTPPYLCVDLLNMMAGIKTVHVPYFGENQMVTDLLGGQIMVGFGGISSGIGHIKAGKLRALASDDRRAPGAIARRADGRRNGAGFRGQRLERHRRSQEHAAAGRRQDRERGQSHSGRSQIQGALDRLSASPSFRCRPAEFGKFIVTETEKWRQSGQVRRAQAAVNDALVAFPTIACWRSPRRPRARAAWPRRLQSATIGSARTAVPKPQSTPAISRSRSMTSAIPADALRDQARMLDEIRGRIDDARNENFVVGNLDCLEIFPLVLVARIGGLDAESLQPRLEGDVDDFRSPADRGCAALRNCPSRCAAACGPPAAPRSQPLSAAILRSAIFVAEFVVGQVRGTDCCGRSRDPGSRSAARSRLRRWRGIRLSSLRRARQHRPPRSGNAD